jgi:hypothetical protein
LGDCGNRFKDTIGKTSTTRLASKAYRSLPIWNNRNNMNQIESLNLATLVCSPRAAPFNCSMAALD